MTVLLGQATKTHDKVVARTTHIFGNNKRSQSVIYYRDGRKKVLADDEPWYMNAWKEFRNKLTVCHNPCVATTQ